MQRLMQYFLNAEVCIPLDQPHLLSSEEACTGLLIDGKGRRIGIEIETLFVNFTDEHPISIDTAQHILRSLSQEHGFTISERHNDLITCVTHVSGLSVVFELGSNNIETITGAFTSEGITFSSFSLWQFFSLLFSVAYSHGAKALAQAYDDHAHLDTLIIPDERDRIWCDLDGDILKVLGHIASIHFNIEVSSIEEAMCWIARLNQYYRDKEWPPTAVTSIWDRYISESLAGYEIGRYGFPPECFEEYCLKLSEYKVVMNTVNGELAIANPALPFAECTDADIDLFLRSVWWHSRLRARNNRLVLETRAVPRGSMKQLEQSFDEITALLGIQLGS